MEGVPQGYTFEEAVMHLPADNPQQVMRRLLRVCEMLRRQRDACADGERRAMAALDSQSRSSHGRCVFSFAPPSSQLNSTRRGVVLFDVGVRCRRGVNPPRPFSAPSTQLCIVGWFWLYLDARRLWPCIS